MNNISLGILHLLNEHQQIEGTETLARMLNAKRHSVLTNALLLEKNGMIEIIPGWGRGNKSIYRDAGVLRVRSAGTKRS